MCMLYMYTHKTIGSQLDEFPISKWQERHRHTWLCLCISWDRTAFSFAHLKNSHSTSEILVTWYITFSNDVHNRFLRCDFFFGLKEQISYYNITDYSGDSLFLLKVDNWKVLFWTVFALRNSMLWVVFSERICAVLFLQLYGMHTPCYIKIRSHFVIVFDTWKQLRIIQKLKSFLLISLLYIKRQTEF